MSTAIVTHSLPDALPICAGAVTTQTGGLASGSAFPVGVTTNVFLVTDAAGNKATRSFSMTVSNNEPPVISSNTNIVANVYACLYIALVCKTPIDGTTYCD